MSVNASAMNGADEHTPLVRRASEAHDNIPDQREGEVKNSRERARTRLAVFCFTIVAYLYNFGTVAAQTALLEHIICNQHFQQVPHVHPDCTDDSVQRELAIVSQGELTAKLLPGLLLNLPYGILADRIGRRTVFGMSLVGILLSQGLTMFILWQADIFSPKLIWFAHAFRIIGGGEAVAVTMIFAALADVFPADARATVFAQIASAAWACQLVAPLLGAFLMLTSPWVPLLSGYALFACGSLISLYTLPETAPSKAQDSAPHLDQSTSHHPTASILVRCSAQCRLWVVLFCQYCKNIFSVKGALPLLFGFFTTTIGDSAAGFELQYVHKRYGWSYSYAAAIMTVRSAVALAVLSVFLPLCNRIAASAKGWSTNDRDIAIMRTAAAFLTIGALVLSAASTSWTAILAFIFLAFGAPLTVVGKSLLTALGPKEMAGTLLSSINTAASLGAVVAGPILAASFQHGLRKGGSWIGFPLLVIALFYASGFISVLCVRASKAADVASKHNIDDGETA
ncbi:Hypothetical protein R9X50_00349700 [Acrodontium crateriforme]|uniref:Major facilitator superfamily (MFS) profile domain-containing protein n=1 Tax=Acrodontium crateriforme TaxID=150365 RepID=A0AAQ3M460_9PEZI|nr:Hypothetical protein R9X50_00349700 [Acrodontium crateriforme]